MLFVNSGFVLAFQPEPTCMFRVQVDLQFPVKKQANNAEANLSVAGYCMSVPCDAKPDMW